MPQELALKSISEDDAIARIVYALRNPRRRDPMSDHDYGYSLYVPNVIHDVLIEERSADQQRNPGPRTYRSDMRSGSEPFYSAAWNLCLRGILAPGPVHPGVAGVVIGGGFQLTSYGRAWLRDTSGYETIPSEYGRFAQILSAHSERFGGGYHSRSQEAAKCYQAHAYLACCAMCGAAAESILLALAVGKVGDEERVLREYRSANGRSKTERVLTGQKNPRTQQDFATYMGLLKYWRDSAAHGELLLLQEEEAFTSLMLLLRLAQFADAHWSEFTT